MKILAPIALAAAIAGILPYDPPVQSAKVNIDRVKESLVMINIGREDDKEGVCTGFVVDPAGRIVTAQHCVEGAKWLKVDGEDTHVLKVEGWVALLDGIPGKHPPIRIAKDLPTVLETVWTFGTPNGWGVFVFERRVASILQPEGEKHHDVFMDGEVGFGMSGGPIVNAKGEVVAVNQMTFSPGGFSMGCGLEVVRELLK